MYFTDYVIEQDEYTLDMVDRVKQRMGEGWVLVGNPFTFGGLICQALAKPQAVRLEVKNHPELGPLPFLHLE